MWVIETDSLRKYIYGGHVSEYMEELQEDDDEEFRRSSFSLHLSAGITADDIEDIHANPC
jgi:large subunit ribosomal protein L5e